MVVNMNKPLLYTLAIAAIAFAQYRTLQRWHDKGYSEAAAKYERQALEAAKLQTIEQEKQNAQTANANLRRELDRLQQRITQQSRQGASVKNLPETARPSADANAAQGWVLLGECGKRYAAMAEIADGQRDKLAEWQAWGEVVSELQ